MNLFTTFFRIAVVTMSIISFTNIARNEEVSRGFIQVVRPSFATLGSCVAPGLCEKKDNVIRTKAALGAAGYWFFIETKNNLEKKQQNNITVQDLAHWQKRDHFKEGRREAYAEVSRAVGYYVVNRTLRSAADKYDLNEDYIDKKCDEYLSEDVAWIVKPFAKVAVDLAYDYVTVEIIDGLARGINGSK
jgi:hypothetical protein